METWENPINKKDIDPVEKPENIFRRTLAYNNEVMLCHFEMKKGANIPLHNHEHVQIGYVIKGALRFITEKGDMPVKMGDSYVFNSYEKHGAEVLENSEVIEVFAPCRDEYKP
jgi:quercetin dioxygenase-like cupin family protein